MKNLMIKKTTKLVVSAAVLSVALCVPILANASTPSFTVTCTTTSGSPVQPSECVTGCLSSGTKQAVESCVNTCLLAAKSAGTMCNVNVKAN